MSIDLTPSSFEIISAREKLLLPDDTVNMGQRLGGITVNPNSIVSGSGNNLYTLDANGMYMGSALWSTAPFKVDYSGNLTATSVTITGGILKHGKTSFADTVNAGYYISSDGVYAGAANDTTKLKYTIGTGAFDFIGTISGRATSTIAGAIDTAGHFIDDVLNTSTRYLLKDFVFSPSDYSGAFKSGDIAWNTTTGAITGGSGILMFKKGIIGANAGVTTFSIDGTTGNATFAGTLSAVSGTLGSLTLITGGNIKLGQTAYATGTGFWMGDDAGTTKLSIGSATNYIKFDGTDIIMSGAVNTDTGISGAAANLNTPLTMGTDATFDIQPIAGIQDTYIDEYQPDFIYGSATTLKLGNVLVGGVYYKYHILIKFALTDVPEVMSALDLMMKVATANAGVVAAIYRITSSWNAADVTWTTKPTWDTTMNWGSFDATTTGWKTMSTPFKELFMLWKLFPGTYPNHGIIIAFSGAADLNLFSTVYADNIGDADRPKLNCTGMQNPTKAYPADIYESPYSATRFIGFGKNTVGGADQNLLVQSNGIVSGMSGLKPGADYYLDESGQIATFIDDIDGLHHDKLVMKIGTAISATKLLIKQPTLSYTTTFTATYLTANPVNKIFVPIPFAASKLDIVAADTTYPLEGSVGVATAPYYEYHRIMNTGVFVDNKCANCRVGDGGSDERIDLTVLAWTQTGILFATGGNIAGSITVKLTAAG